MSKQFDFGNNKKALENLLGSSNTVKAIQIPMEILQGWQNQPFKEHSIEQLTELVTSIERHGLLHNPVVRKITDNHYQILSGHNRIKACQLLKWTTVPCIVKEHLTDEEAEEIMLDSNLNQRQILTHKEKILAYSRIYALRKQSRNGTVFTYQDNVRTVQRYAQMGNLIPEFIEMIDQNKLSLGVAYELSYLATLEQRLVEFYLANYAIQLTVDKVKQLREVDKLTEQELERIIYQQSISNDNYKVVAKVMQKLSTKPLPLTIESYDLQKLVEYLVLERIIK